MLSRQHLQPVRPQCVFRSISWKALKPTHECPSRSATVANMQVGGPIEAETQPTAIRGAWFVALLPLVIAFLLRWISAGRAYIRFAKSPAFLEIFFRRPQGLSAFKDYGGPEILSAVLGVTLVGLALITTTPPRPPFTAGPRTVDEGSRFVHRAGIIWLLRFIVLLLPNFIIQLAWTRQWNVDNFSTVAFGVAYWTGTGLALVLLWMPVGIGPTGFADAGARIRKESMPLVALAIGSTLILRPLLSRLGLAFLPSLESAGKFHWSWYVVASIITEFIYALTYLGLFYPALLKRFNRPYMAEALLAIAFCAAEDPHAWPRRIFVALVGAYCYRRSGSVIPAFAAMCCSYFMSPWLHMLGHLGNK